MNSPDAAKRIRAKRRREAHAASLSPATQERRRIAACLATAASRAANLATLSPGTQERRRIATAASRAANLATLSPGTQDRRRIGARLANADIQQAGRTLRYAGNEYYDFEQNPRVAQALLWANNQTFDDNHDLRPISIETKTECIQNVQDEMNPRSTVYGCACCGVWVTLPLSQEPFCRQLRNLAILALSPLQVDAYNAVPDVWKRTYSVVSCSNGTLYALHPPYVQLPDGDIPQEGRYN